MSRLKDICLQVRYEGEPKKLVSQFFDPINPATHVCRVRINSFTRGVLAYAALGVRDLLAKGKTVRLLINMAGSESAKAIDAETAVRKQVAPYLAAAQPTASTELEELARSFEMRIVSPSDSELENSAAAIGLLSDVTGAAVSFEVEPIETISNGFGAVLNTSWSWGDPQLRVGKAIELFDKRWDGSGKTLMPEPSFAREVLAALLYCADHFSNQSDTSGGLRLFAHQQKAIETWKNAQFRGVFKMCTGAGKTISALSGVYELAAHCTAASQRMPPVIVSVPTRVLADQWIGEIKRLGFHSIVPAYNAFQQWNQLVEPTLRSQKSHQPRFIVTTYRTFADDRFLAKLKRAAASGIHALWIADEMHNLASVRLREAMQTAGALFKFRLGLSATPEIEGDLSATEQLLDFFGGICASYELSDGIRDGVLCPYRYYPVPAYLAPESGEKYLRLLRDIDTAKAGSPSLMNLYRETRELLRTSGIQVARFRDLLRDLCQAHTGLHHTLIYCPPGYGTYGGEQSDEIDVDPNERRLIEEVIQVLRDSGLSASSILGETPSDQRAQILQRFADGRLNTLCAIGCLDEGVDVPSIQRAVVLYSVDREKQFVQRRGRILRQPRGAQGKIAEIFDIIILPQGSDMPSTQAAALLNRELRRYRKFAELALNRAEADGEIARALSVATRGSRHTN